MVKEVSSDPFKVVEHLRKRYGDRLISDCVACDVGRDEDGAWTLNLTLVYNNDYPKEEG